MVTRAAEGYSLNALKGFLIEEKTTARRCVEFRDFACMRWEEQYKRERDIAIGKLCELADVYNSEQPESRHGFTIDYSIEGKITPSFASVDECFLSVEAREIKRLFDVFMATRKRLDSQFVVLRNERSCLSIISHVYRECVRRKEPLRAVISSLYETAKQQYDLFQADIKSGDTALYNKLCMRERDVKKCLLQITEPAPLPESGMVFYPEHTLLVDYDEGRLGYSTDGVNVRSFVTLDHSLLTSKVTRRIRQLCRNRESVLSRAQPLLKRRVSLVESSDLSVAYYGHLVSLLQKLKTAGICDMVLPPFEGKAGRFDEVHVERRVTVVEEALDEVHVEQRVSVEAGGHGEVEEEALVLDDLLGEVNEEPQIPDDLQDEVHVEQDAVHGEEPVVVEEPEDIPVDDVEMVQEVDISLRRLLNRLIVPVMRVLGLY